MKRTLQACLCLLAPLLNAKEAPVQIRLISERDGIHPGESFRLGLHIQHNKGWHTYWKNPGDVGLAPSIKWKLPEGFEASPFLWASPELHKMGIIDVQAYHGTVTHVIPMKAPAHLQYGTQITLKGRASWLMCSKQCIPAFEDISITLPVLKQPIQVSKWQGQFSRTLGSQPTDVAGWTLSARTRGERIELEVKSAQNLPPPPAAPWFFCDKNHITTQMPPEYKPNGHTLLIRMNKTEWAPGKIPRLTGHLYSKTGWDPLGTVKNLRVDLPLDTH